MANDTRTTPRTPEELREHLLESQYGARIMAATQRSLSGAMRRFGLDLVAHPARTLRATADLAMREATVTAHAASRLMGADPKPLVEASAGDRRFTDRGWQENPFLHQLVEGYLVWAEWWRENLEKSGLGPTDRLRARFALNNGLDMMSPSILPMVNPAVIKEAIDTGGLSWLRGMRTMAEDMVGNNGRPGQVDSSGFELGRNLAATPGRVVYRNRLIELIAYEPQTEKVHEIPVLACPPWINKYYIFDLAPGRSWLEYIVQNGFTVFVMSYRNPDASMASLTMDDYLVDGVLAAMDQVQRLTGAPRVNLIALCIGGTYAVLAAAHLAAKGQADRLGCVTLTNTLVDFSEPGDLGVFADEGTVRHLEEAMKRKGYFEASQMASTFDWLRGNDLIWNYVVSNWHMGRKPPSFDILAWNADSTNMPATMHIQYLKSLYLENRLSRPGAFTIAGTPIDLSKVRTPFYVLGAEADHITLWKGTYRTTQLLRGEMRYVLTNSGHIAGPLNPPGSPKSVHWTNDALPADPDRWRAGATRHEGSWWVDWVGWLSARSGATVTPPVLPSGEPAPGRYVRNQTGPEFAPPPRPRPPAAATRRSPRRAGTQPAPAPAAPAR